MRSRDRVLSTHAGSLPRPDDHVRDRLCAKGRGDMASVEDFDQTLAEGDVALVTLDGFARGAQIASERLRALR